MSKSGRWIRLVGAFSERNFGDDLLMLASYKFFSSSLPGAVVSIAVSDVSKSGYVTKLCPGAVVEERFYPIPQAWDYEIYAGGTQFYSFPHDRFFARELDVSLAKNFAKKSRVLFRKVVWRFLSKIYKTPRRFAVGIGIGPFESGNEEASRKVLAKMEKIWVRDPEALQYPRQWGVSSVEEGADWCFASGLVGLPSLPEPKSEVTRVGVIIRGWDYATKAVGYLEQIVKCCRSLVNGGIDVRVFSFCDLADRKAIVYFRENGFDVDVWDPDLTSIGQYLDRVSACDFLVSARFHGVVVGALLGLPSIGLSVDPKVRQVCRKLGLEKYVWDGDFLADDLSRLSKLMISEIKRVRQSMKAAVEAQSQDADTMLRGLCEELDK